MVLGSRGFFLPSFLSFGLSLWWIWKYPVVKIPSTAPPLPLPAPGLGTICRQAAGTRASKQVAGKQVSEQAEHATERQESEQAGGTGSRNVG
ncbi:hypothetical protein L873DRAFT_1797988, partial [Choiromyces venosus 120613-1]